jgi:sphingomyelin phosphodiesterase acid-like 3
MRASERRGCRAFLLTSLLALIGICALAAPLPATKTFLIASDLHFNPMADAKLVDELNTAPAAQWERILNRSTSTAFSQYGQDTNWWLLRSALNAMRTTLPRPAFILVTGDMLAHHFPSTYRQSVKKNDPESYRKFILKTMEFLALQVQKRFPNTRIMITPGNNDDDCQDYGIEAGGAFLQDTAEVARKLARGNEQFTSSWETLGSYDVPHPAVRDVRIISLNSIFFSAKYQAQRFSEGCARVPSTAPDDLFAWVKERLSLAHEAHQKVWLMFHIPPGMDGYSSLLQYQSALKTKSNEPPAQLCATSLVPMWAPKWTAAFDELLAQYADTVIASFAGHTHTDDFLLINAATATPSFVLVNPAFSPVYNQNPGFRVATIAKDGMLIDSSVYYLTNLIFASSTTPGEWKKEYTFSQQWKVHGIDQSSLTSIYESVTRDESARDDWLKFYNVSSPAALLPAGTAPFLYCAVEGLNAESYGSCTCPALGQAP